MILGNAVDNFHKLFDFLVGIGNLHTLAAQYIGRAHENGIAQAVRHLFGFLCRKYGAPSRTGDAGLL